MTLNRPNDLRHNLGGPLGVATESKPARPVRATADPVRRAWRALPMRICAMSHDLPPLEAHLQELLALLGQLLDHRNPDSAQPAAWRQRLQQLTDIVSRSTNATRLIDDMDVVCRAGLGVIKGFEIWQELRSRGYRDDNHAEIRALCMDVRRYSLNKALRPLAHLVCAETEPDKTPPTAPTNPQPKKKRGVWDFEVPGHFGYGDTYYRLAGVARELLEAFVDAPQMTMKHRDIQRVSGPSVGVDRIYGRIFDLRTHLKQLLNLPSDWNPIMKAGSKALTLHLPSPKEIQPNPSPQEARPAKKQQKRRRK